jgi:hypothetical protein
MRPTDAVVVSLWPSEYDAKYRGLKKRLRACDNRLSITFEPLIYPHDFLKAIKRLDNGYNQIVLDARSLRIDDLATSIHWRYGRSRSRGGMVIRTT